MKIVGIVGLGNMGAAMAVALQSSGFQVVATAATELTRRRAATTGLTVVETPADVAEAADVVLLALPTPEAVAVVVEGPNGLEQGLRPSQLIVDTTTSDALTSRRLAAKLRGRQIAFLDAPVSGAPEAARNGQLTMMIGGDVIDVERADSVLKAISSRRYHVGPTGAGNAVKLVNNLMAAAHLLVASEAIELARNSGIEAESLLEVINASTGRSFITERVYPEWILKDRFDLGFAVKLMRKDVRLAACGIERLDMTLPLLSAVTREWMDSATYVQGDEDITRIVELTRRRAAAQRSDAYGSATNRQS
ncbi:MULTISPECIES: NAD(P)-dependent oxidoreductase [Variovorax]|uniref:NAD(P)-dependent oxidoreductase n=1 Tax=Variovorax TaxID=34072 RepID=UPI0028619545|nr:NAD(P)-dependent oxidoreductase [Variovorax sp. 3319]MDR6891000.1 3-hydroxyisobutyrate dehydrogenase [Variovorax sp. 3319]